MSGGAALRTGQAYLRDTVGNPTAVHTCARLVGEGGSGLVLHAATPTFTCPSGREADAERRNGCTQ